MLGKKYLPKSLFGRTLLIVVAPTVLIQIVMAYVFFDRHWDYVTRQMSKALAGDAAFLVMQLKRVATQNEWRVVSDFEDATGITVSFDDKGGFKASATAEEFSEFREQLAKRIQEPFSIRKIEDGETLEIRIKVEDHMLKLTTSVKRLESRTTAAFLAWMLGVSVVFLCIAVVFLRNQIRPMHRLAEAAENFGRGMDTPNFRPHGATEVRKAAKAFIVMRERLKRQIRTRTDMLSGISHDLRTPLTRMKLQLAMMEENEAIKELSDDVQQMEHMIAEYLDFARGEGREEALATNLKSLLEDVVSDYTRTGKNVALVADDIGFVDIRASSFRRMLHNVIDNAIRYGSRCQIAMTAGNHTCTILLDDDGPGIPEALREEVFRPFSRLDPSRNAKTGGVGLGLTIARDVALAHGGGISLAASPLGGLRLAISLPL